MYQGSDRLRRGLTRGQSEKTRRAALGLNPSKSGGNGGSGDAGSPDPG